MITINGTTGIAGANGSASTPAVQGEDTNTGVFFPAADAVAVATGGSERMRVDSSGNVGVGVTPTNNGFGKTLQVGQAGAWVAESGSNRWWLASNWYLDGSDKYINNGFATIYSQQSGAHYWFTAPSGTAGNAITFTQPMTLDASGNLLVGATSYIGGVEARLTVVNKAGNANNSVASFKASATTTATTMLSFYDGGDTFCGQIFISPAADTTSYATSSDYRLKEDVQPMTGGLERVLQLKPCTYTWKKSGSVGEGFIAHELAEVCPAAVIGEKDAVNEDGGINPQMIDTSFLVATLVAALKELKAEVDSLKAQLEAAQ
jgi:hypothetical protein